MTTTDTRNRWLETYRRLTEAAEGSRESQSVAFGLRNAYDRLSSAEKADVHEVLAEWLDSDNNKLRYDAEFLTSQRQIVEMAPAIIKSIQRIGKLLGPEAKYEVEKLRRILNELTGFTRKR
jgi:hypothetical protein